MNLQQSTPKQNNTSFKIIFGVYLRTSRRRLLTSIITGAVIFLTITTFFMTWYSLRYNAFYTYVEENHDWIDDNKISIFGSDYLYGEYSISDNNYLNQSIAEVLPKLDATIPGIRKGYTAGMRFNVYTNESYNILNNDLVAYDKPSTNILTTCLVQGRMPIRFNETVFYQKDNSWNISLNDIVSFQSIGSYSDYDAKLLNCTVVGIVKNVETIFYQNNVSSDFLSDPYAYYGGGMNTNKVFFTKPSYLCDVVNYFPQIEGEFSVGLDISYQISVIHIKNMQKIIKKTKEIAWSENQFNYLPGYYINFCDDLTSAFKLFEKVWIQQTISVFSASLPLLFLFGIIIIETFNIGSFEQESKFRLLKTHGLEFKTLRKMLLLENLITASSSLVVGYGLGLLSGYFVFLGLNISKEVNYIAATIEPFIIIGLIMLFIGFFAFGLAIQLAHAKRTSQTATRQYQSKRRKLIRKFFTNSEVIFLIPGILLTAIGIMGLTRMDLFSDFELFVNPIILVLFWFVTVFGVLFTVAAIFLILTRILNLFWTKLGNKIWTNTKSNFALTLKHLAIYNKNYQRMILAMFILGLGLTPGFIIGKSIDDHNVMESNLSIGCSDLVVENWDRTNLEVRTNISKITGIDYISDVSITSMDFWSNKIEPGGGSSDSYKIRLYTIHNISEYLQTIELSRIKTKYTTNDIEQLSKNLTYIMNKKHAKDNKFDRDVIFKTTMITSHLYEAYSMEYVNSFEIFPLLKRNQPILFERLFMRVAYIDLILSETTTELLVNRTDNSIAQQSYLLINAKQDANLTKIKETLSNDYNLQVKTIDEAKTQLDNSISRYAQTFLVITSILTLIAIFFIGLITAINTYRQRLRIIESEFLVGAQRRQIWSSFTFEILFVIPIPIAISMAIGIPIINSLSGLLLNVTGTYKKFVPWMPWWMILVIIAVAVVVLVGSWLSKMIPLVKNYEPIKQE